MFKPNVKVMFKVNGYEFKVRNTSESSKQVSLHDKKDGSSLASYPLHSNFNFNFDGITNLTFDFVSFANAVNVLKISKVISKGEIELRFRKFHNKELNSYRLEVKLSNTDKVIKYYAGSHLAIDEKLIMVIVNQLNIAKAYAIQLIKVMKLIEYKDSNSNW